MSYALCNDRRTLLWFANQRAIEYHPTLVRADDLDHPTHLVLDLDPPEGDAFGVAVRAAHLVRQALADVGLAGAVKTSGAKGVHVFVPVDGRATMEDVAAATRAIAARAERLDPDAGHHGVHPGRPRAARCSSTRPGPAGRPSWRPTARGSGPARRCRSRWPGTSSTDVAPGRLHRAHGAPADWPRRPLGGRDAWAAAIA